MIMDRKRLEEILERISETRILVFGDYFLDQYWIIDPKLEEISLETGLPANQVVDRRLSAGAAGTVANDVAALGAREVIALGIVGDDGNGLEVIRSLKLAGVSTDQLIVTQERFTPTYTKPLFLQEGRAEVEGQRTDLKNRTPTPAELEKELIKRLRSGFLSVGGVIVLDQVQEADCGAVTTSLRRELQRLAASALDRPCLADSRTRIHEFGGLLVKMNENEARQGWSSGHAPLAEILRAIHSRTRRPVVITRGERGVMGFDGAEYRELPAVHSPGPLDIVGAGDAFSAAFLSTLAATGDFWEAIHVGILASAVTVRKLGTTGTASPDEILEMLSEVSSHS